MDLLTGDINFSISKVVRMRHKSSVRKKGRVEAEHIHHEKSDRNNFLITDEM